MVIGYKEGMKSRRPLYYLVWPDKGITIEKNGGQWWTWPAPPAEMTGWQPPATTKMSDAETYAVLVKYL